MKRLFLLTEVDDVGGVRRRPLDGRAHGYSDVAITILLGGEFNGIGYQVDQN